jgi:hypothetical protein
VLYSQNEATKKASADFDKASTNAELYYRRILKSASPSATP